MGPETKKSKSPIRTLVRYALFIIGAVGPINTAYEYLTKGTLKTYGLVTTLTLKAVILNCGYVTGLFLYKWLLFAVAVGCFIGGGGGLIMIPVALAVIFLWVPYVLYLQMAARFSERKAARLRSLQEMAERTVKKLDAIGSWYKEWEEPISLIGGSLIFAIAFILNVANFIHPENNPLAIHITFTAIKARFLTAVGLIVLVIAYFVGYKSISDYVKEIKKDD